MTSVSQETKVTTKQTEDSKDSNSSVDNNVCATQKTFNKALKKSMDFFSKENKEYIEKNKNKFALCVLLYLVLLVWAVLLSMKVQDNEHRIIHTVIALVCPPTYIISYYLNNFNGDNKTKTPE
jgi:hypothetical protein